jgi:hypothetical protein
LITSEAPSALSRSAFSAVEVVVITRVPKELGELQRKDRNAARTLRQNRVAGGYPAMAHQRHPRCHRSAGQGRSFLEGEVARHRHDAKLCRTATAAFEDHKIAVVSEFGRTRIGICFGPGRGSSLDRRTIRRPWSKRETTSF